MKYEYASTWHPVHIFLTLFTMGLWLFVYALIWSNNAKHNRKIDWKYQQEQIELLQKIHKELINRPFE